MLQFRHAAETDEEVCTAIAERAFQNDPLFRAVTGGKAKSHHRLMSMFIKMFLKNQAAFLAEKESVPVGLAVVASQQTAAVSVGDCFRCGAVGAIFSCGLGNILSLLGAMGEFNRACDRLPSPRHNLTLLAVSPEHQGKGIGSALLRDCLLPYLRKEKSPLLCLNTNTEANCRFYEKNGFTQIGQTTQSIGGAAVKNWSFSMEL